MAWRRGGGGTKEADGPDSGVRQVGHIKEGVCFISPSGLKALPFMVQLMGRSPLCQLCDAAPTPVYSFSFVLCKKTHLWSSMSRRIGCLRLYRISRGGGGGPVFLLCGDQRGRGSPRTDCLGPGINDERWSQTSSTWRQRGRPGSFQMVPVETTSWAYAIRNTAFGHRASSAMNHCY